MNRRTFLTSTGLAAMGLAALPQHLLALDQKLATKNWVWITPDPAAADEMWKQRFADLKEAGINAILLEVYNGRKAYWGSSRLPVESEWLERLIPLAKEAGLELHAWMWTMPCLIPAIQQEHPEWFNVNGKGESSLEKPAYVPYYKFLCPSREPVHEFIRQTVEELCQYDIDGVHLDYVRHPDVILAKGLWPKYDIVQDKEYPQYDYCYCDNCRKQFMDKGGEDPLKMEDPSQSQAWRQFRYNLVTNMVNNVLIPEAHKHGKLITAAVFPNWEMVRQEWRMWELDAALPMLYHSFYLEDLKWIKEQCKKEIDDMIVEKPIYSGLFVPALSPEELKTAVKLSLKGGASGFSLFSWGAMTAAHWAALRE